MSQLETLFSLEGQVALVTGASSGLGAQTARALAHGGAAVGLVARRAERLEELAGELAGLGVRCCTAPADLTDREQIDAVIDRVESSLGAG